MIRRLLGGLVALTLMGTAPPTADRISGAIDAGGFRGAVLVARDDDVLFDQVVGFSVEDDPADSATGSTTWPWESVTKQIVATLVMQQVAAGRLALDTPASRWLPDLGPNGPTLRQLLQHRSGLRNPDDDLGPDGLARLYTAGGDPIAWCLTERKTPGGNWRYNNCDYHVLGKLLERVTGKPLAQLFAERIARPAGMKARFISPTPYGGTNVVTIDRALKNRFDGFPRVASPKERPVLGRFGAAAGLGGSARDLLAFDRALMTGKLLARPALAEMWNGDPKLGYQALGQWVFTAPLKGCAAPVRIVERRGGIGRFQSRNIILPDQGISVILFTADGDYDFGEIWQGKGLSYDVLSAAACPT